MINVSVGLHRRLKPLKTKKTFELFYEEKWIR